MASDVADRIHDAVAIVVERNRGLAVAVDDEIGVLEYLPAGLDRSGEGKPQAQRPVAGDEPRQCRRR